MSDWLVGLFLTNSSICVTNCLFVKVAGIQGYCQLPVTCLMGTCRQEKKEGAEEEEGRKKAVIKKDSKINPIKLW